MIVMQYGSGLQPSTWFVREKRPPQYLRIYLMDGGSVVYSDALRSMPLKHHHLYVFPAQQAYSLTQRPEDPIRCLWMHADVFPYIVQRPIEICPAEHPDLQATLELMRSQVRYPSPNAACVEAFCMAILRLLIRDGFLKERIDSALIDPAMISSTASVAAISRQTGYTEEHFIRAFTKAAGVTPYQYILSQRMNEAISLLSQGMMLDEIAGRLGYASGKSFAGAFKRRFGIAPNVYREHFLKKA